MITKQKVFSGNGQNNSQPLISFIIPALNEELDLAETIKPLKLVNHLASEIIVADGGSTDKTVGLAKKLADKVYERHQERNRSIAENRNKGASLATGQFLFFLDCGVRIENLEELVEKALQILEREPAVVGLTIKVRFFPAEEQWLDKIFLFFINNAIYLSNKFKIGLAMGWVQVVRRETFWEIGGYNENLITTEDSDLFRRLNKIGRTIYLKDFIAYGSAARYHQDGWLKVTKRWFLNLLWYFFAKRSYSKNW